MIKIDLIFKKILVNFYLCCSEIIESFGIASIKRKGFLDQVVDIIESTESSNKRKIFKLMGELHVCDKILHLAIMIFPIIYNFGGWQFNSVKVLDLS